CQGRDIEAVVGDSLYRVVNRCQPGQSKSTGQIWDIWCEALARGHVGRWAIGEERCPTITIMRLKLPIPPNAGTRWANSSARSYATTSNTVGSADRGGGTVRLGQRCCFP